MKKTILNIAVIALLLLTNACNKLELSPEDYYTSSSFWKTTAQVDGAMIGLHNQLRGFQFTFFTLGELRSGAFKDATGATGTSSLNSASVIRQDLRESSPGISSWAGCYGPVFQVNNFIYQVEQATYLSDAGALSVNTIFSSRLTYNKGSMITHMLRWKLGDVKFFQA